MNIKKIIEESIQGYNIPKKKSCSCGCNTCHDKKKLLNESKELVKHLVKETYKKLKAEKESLKESQEKFQVIFRDINSEETPVKQLFNSQKEAQDWVDSNEWEENHEFFNRDGEEEFGTRSRYYNPEDKDNYFGYDIEPAKGGSLKEETTSFLYKLEGILVTNTHERNQTDILSDIRSISGVTIVSSKEYSDAIATDSSNYTTYLSVKIDPHPFIGKGGFGKETLKLIYSEIKKVIGVKSFRLKKKPERINEDNQSKGQNFGFWFRAGVRGEKQAEQAKQLLTKNGIDFNDEGKFAIDFREKGLNKNEIMQLMLDNNITLYVVYDNE